MTASTITSAVDETSPAQRRAKGLRRHLALLVTVAAGVALVVGTIGPPLFGRGVFLASDAMADAYPWRAFVDGPAQNVPHHGPVGDTVDGSFPTRSTFAEAVRDGDFLGWNPYIVGGTYLGSDGSAATLSPFELAYVALPAWFAPAALKLIQMGAAIGFTFLFCRRLGAGRVPALFGGLAFAGSGFMVMWTNWPHPEVAALIPALFWATERFLSAPSVRAIVPIAVSLAVMLLGNFPAVVFHTLYVLVPYTIVRVALMHRQTLRRSVGLLAGAGAGVVTGGLLVAGVLLPFARRLDFLGTDARSQSPGSKLGLDSLLTTVAPKALGLSTEGPDAGYFGPHNQVETIAFVGVTAALLAVLAIALPRLRGSPRGAREVLFVATVVIGWAAFVGGDVLQVLQRLPGFEESFVGRARAILGFMVAVLGAIGLEAVARRHWPQGRRQWSWAIGVVAATGLAGAYAGNRSLWRARGVEQVDVLRAGLVLPAIIGLCALGAVAAASWGGRRVAAGALATVPLLLVVESLAFSLPLLPNEDRSTLYPVTPGIDFLAGAAQGDRVAAQDLTLYGTGSMVFGIRVLTGHGFHSPTWKQAILQADPNAYARSGTFGFLAGTTDVMASPMLDRLGVGWFAATPQALPAGQRLSADAGQPTCDSADGRFTWRDEVTLDVPADAGLRGVVLQVCHPAELPEDAAIDIEMDGASLPARVPLPDAVAPGQLPIVVPGEHARGDTVEVRLTLTGTGDGGLVLAQGADGDVIADPVAPGDDGLRLAYADDLVVYRRLNALDRIRWAETATVLEEPQARLDELASGDLPADRVLLSADGPSGAGEPADVEVRTDTPTSISADVDAHGDGYLVVADALQQGWVARVDGEPAELVAADHAGVAVHVTAGRHEITLRHRPPGQRLGLAMSAVSVLALVGAWLWGDRLAGALATRVSRRRGTDQPPEHRGDQPPERIDQRPSSEVSPP